MPNRVDDGLGERRKKEKTGFKEDRRARYLERQGRTAGKKNSKTSRKGDEPTKRVREVKFDASGRNEFLGQMHKRKNERRVNAMVEARKKVQKENVKFRRDQREEARKQYNAYARVPILPDYTFRLPRPDEEGAVEAGRGRDDDDDEDEDDDASYASSSAMESDVEHVFEPANTQQTAGKKLRGMTVHATDAGAVTVDVQPLFGNSQQAAQQQASKHGTGRPQTAGRKSRFVGGMDFADLPTEVAQKLTELQKARKGDPKMKAKVSMMKEMVKFHRIQKNSRKKSGSGSKGKGKGKK